ncbi:MAG: AAA family ATPase, partial [Planctomycetes bacterium]|nr:AAA family ATPase [Planctomycetota bacterium]
MMKLLNVKFEGFRSLRDVTWEPGDLNVLIGPNAGGKSNLLRILELLSISVQHGLSKHIQKEGGMGAL